MGKINFSIPIRKTQLYVIVVLTAMAVTFNLSNSDEMKTAFLFSTTIGPGALGIAAGWASSSVKNLASGNDRPFNVNIAIAFTCAVAVAVSVLGINGLASVAAANTLEGIAVGFAGLALGIVNGLETSASSDGD